MIKIKKINKNKDFIPFFFVSFVVQILFSSYFSLASWFKLFNSSKFNLFIFAPFVEKQLS